jgi:hypothetical protein
MVISIYQFMLAVLLCALVAPATAAPVPITGFRIQVQEWELPRPAPAASPAPPRSPAEPTPEPRPLPLPAPVVPRRSPLMHDLDGAPDLDRGAPRPPRAQVGPDLPPGI